MTRRIGSCSGSKLFASRVLLTSCFFKPPPWTASSLLSRRAASSFHPSPTSFSSSGSSVSASIFFASASTHRREALLQQTLPPHFFFLSSFDPSPPHPASCWSFAAGSFPYALQRSLSPSYMSRTGTASAPFCSAPSLSAAAASPTAAFSLPPAAAPATRAARSCATASAYPAGVTGSLDDSAAIGALAEQQKKVEGEAADAAVSTTLFQYTVCAYCTSVREVLRFFRHPYRAVEVSPFGKKELSVLPDKAYRKVPIALIEGEQVNGSLNITRQLCRLHGWNAQQRPFQAKEKVKETGRLLDTEESAIVWAHDHLVPIFPACMYESLKDCWTVAGRICAKSNFTPLERFLVRVGAPPALYYVGKKTQKKRGIKDPLEALHEGVAKWMQRVREKEEGKIFHGGAQPDVADVAVYGFLRALQVCPAVEEIRSRSAEFDKWFAEVEKHLAQRSGT